MRDEKRVSEGRSEELGYEESVSEEGSNKDGGASKEYGEHRSEKARPATVLARGLVKLYLGPKESICEGHEKKGLGGDRC